MGGMDSHGASSSPSSSSIVAMPEEEQHIRLDTRLSDGSPIDGSPSSSSRMQQAAYTTGSSSYKRSTYGRLSGALRLDREGISALLRQAGNWMDKGLTHLYNHDGTVDIGSHRACNCVDNGATPRALVSAEQINPVTVDSPIPGGNQSSSR